MNANGPASFGVPKEAKTQRTLSLVFEESAQGDALFRTLGEQEHLRRLVRDIVLLNPQSRTVTQVETHSVWHAGPHNRQSKYTTGGALGNGEILAFLKNPLYLPILTEDVVGTIVSRLQTSNELLALDAVDLSGSPTEQNRRLALPGIIAFRKQNIPDITATELELDLGDRRLSPLGLNEEALLSLVFFYRHQTLVRTLLPRGRPVESLRFPVTRASVYGIRRNYRILEKRVLETFFRATTIPDSELAKVITYSFEPGRNGHDAGAAAKPQPIRNLILRCGLSPGDILMLTAAVRDLHLSHPGKFATDVRTPAKDIWLHNPFITELSETRGAEVIDMEYPLVHYSNQGPYHFIHGYRKYLEERLAVTIRPTRFSGQVYLSNDEAKGRPIIAQEPINWKHPFWLICVGGKLDYTAKWWIPEYGQEVVDHFKDRIQFVQFGATGNNHQHPGLSGVIDLRGRTSLRDLILLVYHSSGVICPVTFAMHLAAAVPRNLATALNKPCIVTAGGREPSVWEAYTNHQFLHCNGQMECCSDGGCWKARTVPLGDGDEKDTSLCLNTVSYRGRQVQKCMRDFVTASDVIRAVERYHSGGLLTYLTKGVRTISHGTENTGE